MRKTTLILLMVLVLAGICQAVPAKNTIPQPHSVKPKHLNLKNAVVVDPCDDLIAKHNWLKSSDRNSQMGVLSDTNWRHFVLAPGTHWVAEEWVWDTNYISYDSLTGNPDDTIVRRSDNIDGKSVIRQTAWHVKASNFTVGGYNSNGVNFGRGMEYAAYNYSASATVEDVAQFAKITAAGIGEHLLNDGSGYTHNYTIYLTGGGITRCIQSLYYINGFSDANTVFVDEWNPGEYTNVTTVVVCRDGSYYTGMKFPDGYSNDTQSSVWGQRAISGKWIRCDGKGQGFLTVSDKLGRFVYLYAQDCTAGAVSFAGDSTDPNCWDYSTYLNCIGTDGCYGGCTIFGMNTNAFIYNCVGDFGCVGLSWDCNATVINSVFGENSCGGSGTGGWVGKFTGYASNTICGYGSFGQQKASSANTGLIENCKTLSVSLLAGSAGWEIVLPAVLADYKKGISGATGLGTFTVPPKDCHPSIPADCTVDTSVYAFDNGWTYTNKSATAAVKFTLQVWALPGYEYNFVDANNTAAADVNVIPKAIDRFVLPDGTAMNLGESLVSDADKHATLKIKCYDPNVWTVELNNNFTQQNP